MRVWIMLFTGMLLAGSQPAVYADVVHLKNGNVVEGRIIEKTADAVKMDISGVTLTYYMDEILSVDSAASPAAAAAAADAPVAPAVPPLPAEAQVPPPAVPAVADVAPAVVPPPPQVVAPVPPQAVADDLSEMDKNQLISKFVEIYGVRQNMQANFDQMTATLKPEQVEAFRNAVKVDEIVKLLLPIYDKHFTADELRAYIRFYSSPDGKKLVQTLPLLMKDSVDISIKYLDAHLPESLKQN